MAFCDAFSLALGSLLGAPEASWRRLGPSWALLGLWDALGALLGRSWKLLGALGRSWPLLERSWDAPGWILGPPGGDFEL